MASEILVNIGSSNAMTWRHQAFTLATVNGIFWYSFQGHIYLKTQDITQVLFEICTLESTATYPRVQRVNSSKFISLTNFAIIVQIDWNFTDGNFKF